MDAPPRCDVLLTNAIVVTMDERFTVHASGSVAISGRTIVAAEEDTRFRLLRSGSRLGGFGTRLAREVAALIDHAVEVARAAPPPDSEALLRDVYVSY